MKKSILKFPDRSKIIKCQFFNVKMSLFALLFLMCSCSSRLLYPVKGGVTVKRPYNVRQLGSVIYIEPRQSLEVVSMEDCEILFSGKGGDSSLIVVAKGKFGAGYGNLKESYVSKGEHVKKRQIIGKLFDKQDSMTDNNLSVSLQRDGVASEPSWRF